MGCRSTSQDQKVTAPKYICIEPAGNPSSASHFESFNVSAADVKDMMVTLNQGKAPERGYYGNGPLGAALPGVLCDVVLLDENHELITRIRVLDHVNFILWGAKEFFNCGSQNYWDDEEDVDAERQEHDSAGTSFYSGILDVNYPFCQQVMNHIKNERPAYYTHIKTEYNNHNLSGEKDWNMDDR